MSYESLREDKTVKKLLEEGPPKKKPTASATGKDFPNSSMGVKVFPDLGKDLPDSGKDLEDSTDSSYKHMTLQSCVSDASEYAVDEVTNACSQ